MEQDDWLKRNKYFIQEKQLLKPKLLYIIMGDIFIDILVLFFVGTLILILFSIGTTIKEPQPTLFWLVPGLFYLGAVIRFVFRGFFSERKSVVIVEKEDK